MRIAELNQERAYVNNVIIVAAARLVAFQAEASLERAAPIHDHDVMPGSAEDRGGDGAAQASADNEDITRHVASAWAISVGTALKLDCGRASGNAQRNGKGSTADQILGKTSLFADTASSAGGADR